jgi:hypothetical protein
VLQCDCGFQARAADEDGLVAAVLRHALEAHGMALSHGEARLLVSRAADAEAPSRSRARDAVHDPSDDNSSNR